MNKSSKERIDEVFDKHCYIEPNKKRLKIYREEFHDAVAELMEEDKPKLSFNKDGFNIATFNNGFEITIWVYGEQPKGKGILVLNQHDFNEYCKNNTQTIEPIN